MVPGSLPAAAPITCHPDRVLARLADDAWAAGLGRLSDDELIGVLITSRRLASWAAAMELAAVGDLWARRTAEEDAGDTGAAQFADDEIAAALTLTRHAASQVLELAVALGRLPLTAAALAAGDIDLPRAKVIADAVTGLTGAHAAAVDRAVIGAAPGQTTGQLRAAAHRAVLAADPAAARRRKEEALREARVERWAEPAGTAALAGRDLPPASVLAADANLTALARQLKAVGVPGTMDTLRAEVYLALLTGIPVTSLLPSPGNGTSRDGRDGRGGPGGRTGPGAAAPASCRAGVPQPPSPIGSPLPGSPVGGPLPGSPADGSPPGSLAGGPLPGSPADGSLRASPAGRLLPGSVAGGPLTSFPGQAASLGGFPLRGGPMAGSVNLTLPLATWLGLGGAPGHAAGYGPLDAADSRELADALAAQAGTKWCLTVTGPDGQPVAHGCARASPAPGRSATGSRARPAAGSRDRPESQALDRTAAGSRAWPAAGSCNRPESQARDRPAAESRAGPGTRARDRTWTFTLTWLDRGECGHAWETPAYVPSDRLRHLAQIRHVTCTFPGCRRPAAQCDADHTIAYDHGGRTCLCNLAPLCRHHHRCKQAEGWRLEQPEPGVLVWHTPAGRTYTTATTVYPV